jgi:maleylacetoacetate isomerase/maleylpyruvate isomerase
LKGIEYDNHPVHLVKDGGQHLKPEYEELNPAKMVPTL